MHSETLFLFALSASAVVASPLHKRASFAHHHHRIHGTGTGGLSPTGTGALFPSSGNDTNGIFAPTGDDSNQAATLVVTQTVSPLAADSGVNTFGNVASGAASSSCVTTSIATETSTNIVTVTASVGDIANGKAIDASSVSAGAFYGGQGSRSWGGGGWGSHTDAPSVPSSAAMSFAPSAAQPSTTFATMTSGAITTGPKASASSAPPSGGASGGKRGISYNDASLVSVFSGSVSWAYNWAATAGGSLSGVEYVPLMWGLNDVSGFASSVGSATHVLSFNEPDLAAQANIDPQTAATKHKEGMSSLVGKVQIGSPAVTNGASSNMGTGWLDQFLTACGEGCPVNFVAYHWYNTAESIEDFKQHTLDVIKVANDHGINKVWLTEFAPSGSADAQASFMTEAVSFLESTAAVERYAAFMASDGTLLSGNALNSIGSAYVAA